MSTKKQIGACLVSLCLVAAGLDGLAAPALAGAGGGKSPAKYLYRCGTIDKPGNYELRRNLSAIGDCLILATDFITLDLNGYEIRGSGLGRGLSDGGQGLRGIEIKSGSIANFAIAVDLGNSAAIRAQDLRVFDNTGGDTLIECSSEPLLVGRPTGIITGSNSIVQSNMVGDNVGMAIKVGSGSVVADNVVKDNTGANIGEGHEISGICAFSGSQVVRNAIIDNDALAAQANSGSAVSQNSARNNGDGLRVNSGSTVNGNTVHRNTGFGLQVNCPSNVIGNAAVGNGTNIALLGDGCNEADNLDP